METDNSYETAREIQMLWLVYVLEVSHSNAFLSFEFAEVSFFIAGKNNLSLKYNQKDAAFSRSMCIYLYKLLYMFQAVPLPIIRSTKLYIQRQVLSKQYCCLLMSWMRWNCLPSHPRQQQDAVLFWQYLTLYVQFCAPDDGRRNSLKHVEQFIEINRSRICCILLVVLYRYICDAWTYFTSKISTVYQLLLVIGVCR
jgi:hypothetical protein